MESVASNGQKYLTWKDVTTWGVSSVGGLALLVLGAAAWMNHQTAQLQEAHLIQMKELLINHAERPHKDAITFREFQEVKNLVKENQRDLRKLLER